jgi:hypothetical protein
MWRRPQIGYDSSITVGLFRKYLTGVLCGFHPATAVAFTNCVPVVSTFVCSGQKKRINRRVLMIWVLLLAPELRECENFLFSPVIRQNITNVTRERR